MLVTRREWYVSVTIYADKAILNVSRRYWGERSIWQNGDAHGKTFRTSDDAWAFAKSRGYVRQYFRKEKSWDRSLKP